MRIQNVLHQPSTCTNTSRYVTLDYIYSLDKNSIFGKYLITSFPLAKRSKGFVLVTDNYHQQFEHLSGMTFAIYKLLYWLQQSISKTYLHQDNVNIMILK